MDATMWCKHMGLMTNPDIRKLVRTVPWADRNLKTVDTGKAAKALDKIVTEEMLGVPRIVIMEFIMEIWFLGADKFSTEFWSEMHHKIMKLLHVSMVLEARNFKFYANEADLINIPRPLVFLRAYIIEKCTPERFAKIQASFKSNCDRDKEWTGLYLNSFVATKY